MEELVMIQFQNIWLITEPLVQLDDSRNNTSSVVVIDPLSFSHWLLILNTGKSSTSHQGWFHAPLGNRSVDSGIVHLRSDGFGCDSNFSNSSGSTYDGRGTSFPFGNEENCRYRLDTRSRTAVWHCRRNSHRTEDRTTILSLPRRDSRDHPSVNCKRFQRWFRLWSPSVGRYDVIVRWREDDAFSKRREIKSGAIELWAITGRRTSSTFWFWLVVLSWIMARTRCLILFQF